MKDTVYIMGNTSFPERFAVVYRDGIGTITLKYGDKEETFEYDGIYPQNAKIEWCNLQDLVALFPNIFSLQHKEYDRVGDKLVEAGAHIKGDNSFTGLGFLLLPQEEFFQRVSKEDKESDDWIEYLEEEGERMSHNKETSFYAFQSWLYRKSADYFVNHNVKKRAKILIAIDRLIKYAFSTKEEFSEEDKQSIMNIAKSVDYPHELKL